MGNIFTDNIIDLLWYHETIAYLDIGNLEKRDIYSGVYLEMAF
jgi:hypothetical protein